MTPPVKPSDINNRLALRQAKQKEAFFTVTEEHIEALKTHWHDQFNNCIALGKVVKFKIQQCEEALLEAIDSGDTIEVDKLSPSYLKGLTDLLTKNIDTLKNLAEGLEKKQSKIEVNTQNNQMTGTQGGFVAPPSIPAKDIKAIDVTHQD